MSTRPQSTHQPVNYSTSHRRTDFSRLSATSSTFHDDILNSPAMSACVAVWWRVGPRDRMFRSHPRLLCTNYQRQLSVSSLPGRLMSSSLCGLRGEGLVRLMIIRIISVVANVTQPSRQRVP